MPRSIISFKSDVSWELIKINRLLPVRNCLFCANAYTPIICHWIPWQLLFATKRNMTSLRLIGVGKYLTKNENCCREFAESRRDTPDLIFVPRHTHASFAQFEYAFWVTNWISFLFCYDNSNSKCLTFYRSYKFSLFWAWLVCFSVNYTSSIWTVSMKIAVENNEKQERQTDRPTKGKSNNNRIVCWRLLVPTYILAWICL